MNSQLMKPNTTLRTSSAMTKQSLGSSPKIMTGTYQVYRNFIKSMGLRNGCTTMIVYGKVYYSSPPNKILGLIQSGKYLLQHFYEMMNWSSKRIKNTLLRINLTYKKRAVTTITAQVNNTTIIKVARQRFGQDKFMESLEETYGLLLADQAFICNALQNERNLPIHLPALKKLAHLLSIKYQQLSYGPLELIMKYHLKMVDELLKDMTIKFYKYYFDGQEKPVIIEALSKQSANYALEQIMPSLSEKGYFLQDLKDMKVELPIVGVNKKQHQGKSYVWGLQGWMEDNSN